MPIGPWELAIIMIVILGGPVILGILFAIYMIFRARSGTQRETGNNPALEILDHRYARGEIDDEEYQQRRQNLVDSSPRNQ